MAADRDANADQADLPLPKLLAAVASILRDSTGRFEETSDRIAQLVVSREIGTGVDIIVALQEFDRLRQDFDAIEGILAGCAHVIERPATHQAGQPSRSSAMPIEVLPISIEVPCGLAGRQLSKADRTQGVVAVRQDGRDLAGLPVRQTMRCGDG